jgi:hypothetical protein
MTPREQLLADIVEWRKQRAKFESMEADRLLARVEMMIKRDLKWIEAGRMAYDPSAVDAFPNIIKGKS